MCLNVLMCNSNLFSFDQPLVYDYSTGVQIVSCTLSRDSVLSESTGLFNPVLSVSTNEISFDKK